MLISEFFFLDPLAYEGEKAKSGLFVSILYFNGLSERLRLNSKNKFILLCANINALKLFSLKTNTSIIWSEKSA